MTPVERHYRIWSWRIFNPVPDGIPENGFKQDAILKITCGDRTHSLEWCNEPGEGCSIKDLPSDIPSPIVQVEFGNRIIHGCCVDLKFSGDFLKGTLACVLPKGDGGDGNTGTFIAEAIPPKPEPE